MLRQSPSQFNIEPKAMWFDPTSRRFYIQSIDDGVAYVDSSPLRVIIIIKLFFMLFFVFTQLIIFRVLILMIFQKLDLVEYHFVVMVQNFYHH